MMEKRLFSGRGRKPCRERRINAGRKGPILSLAAVLAAWVSMGTVLAQETKVFSRAELIQDTRQLASILEQSHPDPYINGGGRIAFHRRLQGLLRDIPAAGMTQEQFYRRLLPFVAPLRDGHTAILPPEAGGAPRPGLPLAFRIIDESLYVAGSFPKDGDELLGAVLLSIEGIPMRDLVERQNNLRGIENIYGTLALLSRGLGTERGLQTLVPEWTDPAAIRVAFRLASGKSREFSFKPGDRAGAFPASRVKLPDMAKTDVGWRFLDGGGRTAILKIDDMSGYREACESWLASGMSEGPDLARAAYRKFHHRDAPAKLEDVLAGIPAATDAFMDLVVAMKQKGTENLIVDLRENTGGNDLMVPILLYFLFGQDAMTTYDRGYQITKYSDLFFQMYSAVRLEDINRGRELPLEAQDYDFSEERGRGSAPARADLEKNLISELKKAPSFYRIYEKGIYKAHHRPKKLVVLCAAFTYSSGFSMLAALDNLGATLVGTPSAHAGNNFGDSLLFQLKNTQIMGAVSFKQNITYPGDPVKGRCLMPDVRLTYEKLASLNYDPNGEVLLALETLERADSNPR